MYHPHVPFCLTLEGKFLPTVIALRLHGYIPDLPVDSPHVSCQVALLAKLLAAVITGMFDFGLIMYIIYVFPKVLIAKEYGTAEVAD